MARVGRGVAGRGWAGRVAQGPVAAGLAVGGFLAGVWPPHGSWPGTQPACPARTCVFPGAPCAGGGRGPLVRGGLRCGRRPVRLCIRPALVLSFLTDVHLAHAVGVLALCLSDRVLGSHGPWREPRPSSCSGLAGSGPAGDACARPAPRLLPRLCQPISANSARSPSSHCFPKLPWPLVRHVLLPQDSKLEGGPGFERARCSDLPCQLTLPSTPLCVSAPGTANSTLGHFCAHIGPFNQNCACPRSKESESCTRGSMRSRRPHPPRGSGGPRSRRRGQLLLTDLPASPWPSPALSWASGPGFGEFGILSPDLCSD